MAAPADEIAPGAPLEPPVVPEPAQPPPPTSPEPGGVDAGEPADEPFDATARTVSWAEVRIGHCLLELPDSDVVTEVELVDCRAPHVYEVFGSFPAPIEEARDGAGRYPGDGVLSALAEAGCLQTLDALARRSEVDTSGLDIVSLWPTEEGWEEFDVYMTCLVHTSSGEPLVGGPLLTPPRPLP